MKGGTDVFSRLAKNSKPDLAKYIGENGAVVLRFVTMLLHNCHRFVQMFKAENFLKRHADSISKWRIVMNRFWFLCFVTLIFAVFTH